MPSASPHHPLGECVCVWVRSQVNNCPPPLLPPPQGPSPLVAANLRPQRLVPSLPPPQWSNLKTDDHFARGFHEF